MLWVLIASVLPAASAQAQRPTARAIPSVPAPRDPLPRFTIAPRGGVLGPIGFPLPPIGLPPLDSTEQGGRLHSRGHVAYWWPSFYYPPFLDSPGPHPEAKPPVERPPAPGRLVLDVRPAGAQVFADGYYVGLSEDFSAARGGGFLEPGAHRIDLSASGYESMTRDLKVTAGQALTIRESLRPLPPPAAIPPTTFYLIRGCYMGNIPPKDVRLPANCDHTRVETWVP